MSPAPLDREEVRALLGTAPPLVEGFLDLERQLQPHGFDLTLREVASFTTPGRLQRQGVERAGSSPLLWGEEGALHLPPGPYLVTFNEVVSLPRDLMALGRPRSSLLRCGATVHTAVWDAGYRGRSQALLVVFHPQGLTVERGAALLQLVFFRLARPVERGYAGRYQGENL